MAVHVIDYAGEAVDLGELAAAPSGTDMDLMVTWRALDWTQVPASGVEVEVAGQRMPVRHLVGRTWRARVTPGGRKGRMLVHATVDGERRLVAAAQLVRQGV